jgi:iron-sulfur cluster assembly accessory protein
MVKVTDLAIERMRDVVREQNDEGIAVRLFVEASHGHIGFGMGLDNEISEDDTVVDLGGVSLVVDPDSLPYVEGAEIDYVESLMNTGFTVSNPNLVQSAGGCGCGRGTCGCGHNH